ncbi:ribonuclease H-like domain-containing protein [Mycena olivaceomarginata]|nr:ribonuclease H-like domain-containing protein [Mycena olivaceomarginata]KAJ7800751.1 ribonuclease H-like domain-containing protein [Mycena olivaceomarginata]
MASSGFTVSVPSFTIEYITTVDRANECLRLIRDGMSIGFDAEWTSDDEPGAKRKTPGERNAEKRQQTKVPHELERVCASSAIIKAGTGVFCDASRLWKDFRMNLLSCVELGLAFKLVYPETTRPRAFYSELVGLADVAEHVCGMKLDKSQRETDWSKSVLSSEQLQYAATDAYASFECYTRLQSEIDRCEYDIPSAWHRREVEG